MSLELPAHVDAAASRAARDAGLEAVARVSFFKAVMLVLAQGHLVGRRVTGEDLRLHCEQFGVFPHHSNAWGAIVHHLVRRGFLERTGEYRQMKIVTSHARVNPVYRVM